MASKKGPITQITLADGHVTLHGENNDDQIPYSRLDPDTFYLKLKHHEYYSMITMVIMNEGAKAHMLLSLIRFMLSVGFQLDRNSYGMVYFKRGDIE